MKSIYDVTTLKIGERSEDPEGGKCGEKHFLKERDTTFHFDATRCQLPCICIFFISAFWPLLGL